MRKVLENMESREQNEKSGLRKSDTHGAYGSQAGRRKQSKTYLMCKYG